METYKDKWQKTGLLNVKGPAEPQVPSQKCPISVHFEFLGEIFAGVDWCEWKLGAQTSLSRAQKRNIFLFVWLGTHSLWVWSSTEVPGVTQDSAPIAADLHQVKSKSQCARAEVPLQRKYVEECECLRGRFKTKLH